MDWGKGWGGSVLLAGFFRMEVEVYHISDLEVRKLVMNQIIDAGPFAVVSSVVVGFK